MAKGNPGSSRWLRSAWDWIVDQLISHWPAIVAVAGSALMTYFASLSDSLVMYGLVGWGAVGIASLLVLSVAFALFSSASTKLALAAYTRGKAVSSHVNVLAPTHEHERIELSQFYHPFYRPTENVRFENCDLFGPANIAADACSFIDGSFHECEIVLVRPDRPVRGAMMFRHCTFVRFRLYRATFLMNVETYKRLPEQMRANVRVISDGRSGDL